MDAWTVLSAILQLATIYLVGQGGITLSLIGFRPRDANPAVKDMRFLLSLIAFGFLALAIAVIVCLVMSAERFSRPHFEGPDAEKANKALQECLDAPRVGIRRGTPDQEGAAWESLTRYRECFQLIDKHKFDVQVVYDHSLLEFFSQNARLTAALSGLIFVVPGLMYFSVRLKSLDVNKNRTNLIVKACA